MNNMSAVSSPIRIVSYNILDGGVGRADPIAEVLLAQRPDVIALVEADDPNMLARIAWRLGYDHIAAVGRKGRTTALLSRGRILESTNIIALNDGDDRPRSFLLARVEHEDGELPIGVVHLSSKASEERETQREREVGFVLDTLQPLRDANRPHVICGDFNANSPMQQIDPARLPDKTRPHYEKNGNELPRRAIQRVLDAGYADTLGDAGRTACSFTTLQPGQRLDYLFGYSVTVNDAWVEQDRLATYASDHYPIGAELCF